MCIRDRRSPVRPVDPVDRDPRRRDLVLESAVVVLQQPTYRLQMLGLLACAAAFVLPSGQPGAALAPAARAPLAPRPSVTMAGDNFGLTKLKNEGSYFFQGPSPKTVRSPPLEAAPAQLRATVRAQLAELLPHGCGPRCSSSASAAALPPPRHLSLIHI